MRSQRFSRIIGFSLQLFVLAIAASSPVFGESFVKINGYVINVKGQEPAVPQELESAVEGRFKKWIVQFSGPVHEADKKMITDLGARIGDYLPDFAFIVMMDEKTKTQVKTLPLVNGVVRYKPAYKIETKLKDATGAVAAEKGKYVKLHVRVDIADNLSLVLSEVLKGKGRVLNVGKDVALVEIEEPKISRLAKIEEVVWIEKAVDMKLQNDTTKWVIQTNVENNTKLWDKGLHGENQIVGIGDTGLDYDMAWFRDPLNAVPIGPNHRKIAGYDSSYGDSSDANDPGHGTHVAGTIAGDRTPVDGLFSANGMAPKAKTYIQDLAVGSDTQVNPPSDLGLMFLKAYDAGARIHNNSWGGYENTYGTLAMTADRFLWDHKDFLALFANGNTGPNPNTVLNPATAKNVISVGATLNGSSANSVADFSANGLTADGRIKPTVTAPGDGVMERSGIISADSDGNLSGNNSGTTSMRGTSMATAAVSGAAALARQYFMDGYYPTGSADSAGAFTPSAALMKAVIVNSAQNMSGNYSGGTIPATGQGWGRINLSNTLAFTGDARPLAVVDNSDGLTTGESWTQGFFSPGNQPVKMTLVWTDYPGSSEASTALVNDLDLTVTAPDGTTTYLGNVFLNGASTTGGSADRLNVEEQVLMPSAMQGSYTITVTGYNVPNGPQPFALVITNVSNVTSKGSLTLNRSKYNASSTVNIKLGDRDLNLDASVIDEAYVSVKSTSDPGGETIKLTETGPDTAVFIRSISLSTAATGTNDGVLTVADGDIITAVYNDASDGMGNSAAATATATVDLIAPAISALLSSGVTEVSATVTWTTNEAADSKINYGETQSGGINLLGSQLYTQHTLTLTNLKEGKTYYYAVSSKDEAGNTATDDNNGSFYSFATPNMPPSLTVNSSEGSLTYNTSTTIYGISTDASLISSVTVSGIAASYRGSDGYYALPVELAIGDNLLTVVATDNAGNTHDLTITVTRLNTPDLVVSLLSSPTSTAGTSQSFPLIYSICNAGAGDSPAFSVGFYLSKDPTVTTEQSGDNDADIHFENQDSQIVSLATGTCTTRSKSLTVPMNIESGFYYIGAIADYAKAVIESDETNNSAAGNQILVEAPDLAPTLVSGSSTTVSTGDTITISNTVKNNSSSAKSSGFYVDLYLSLDSSITTTDIHLRSRYVDSLNAGAQSTANTTVTIPGNIEGNTYYIGAIADTFNQVTEANENNNGFAENQIAVAGSDLTMTHVNGPATALTGGIITVDNTVTASASGGSTSGFYVGIYLSTDDVISAADDTLIVYRWVSGLVSGASSTEYTQVTVPTYIAPGAYYLGVIADYSGVVLEPEETNNTLAGNQITVTGADLTMTSISGPATAIPGGTITVTNAAQAAATGGYAGNFSVGLYLSSDVLIDTSDIFLGSRSVSSLVSGGTTTDNTAVTIPADLQAGTYYIGAIVDYTNGVKESDEGNNSLKGSQIEILKPDLTIAAVNTQASARTGDTITVSNTAAVSASGASAGSFIVGIYLSTDSAVTTDDILLAERQVSGLTSGGSSAADAAVALPTSLAGGTYYVGAIADNHDAVVESDEANNTLTGNQITIAGPDLAMMSINGPASARTGDSITMNDSVTASVNGGSAGDFSVGIYLSADALITTSDTLIGQRLVHGLAPGQTSSGDTAVTIPVTVAGAVYYIGAIADYANAVPEADRTNNMRAGNPITVAGPDLIMTSVSGPSAGVAGQTITASDMVTASASGGTTGTFSVGIYLSRDNSITSSDMLLDSHYVPGLAPGASLSSSTVVTIPADLAEGTYYIGAIADAYGQVPESNKTNNSLAGNQITITKAYPDLVVTSLTGPNSAATDEQITLAGVVKNQGLAPAGPSWASIYLSTDSSITAGDVYLGDAYVGDLAAGADQTLAMYVTIPANIAGGTYYIGLIADRTGQVAESNDTNNALAGNQIIITKLSPDLVVTSVSGPGTGTVKQQITVTTTVRNQGAVATSSSYVGIYLSADQTVTTGDLYLGQASIAALDPGVDQTVSLTVTLPQSSRGTFSVGAIADRLNMVSESDESNNGLAGNQIVITR